MERRTNINHRSDIDIIKETLLRIELNSNIQNEKIDKIEKKIYGNGVAGILSRVDIIETKIEDFKNNKKENRDVFWKLATFALSIFSGLIAFHKR